MVLLPPDVPDSFDFHAHYFGRRHVFFSGLVLYYIVDVIDAFTKGLGGRSRPWGGLGRVGSPANIGALVAIRTSSDAYHKAHAVFWPASWLRGSFTRWAPSWRCLRADFKTPGAAGRLTSDCY